jgi:group I intron endonuclease
MIIYKTTNTINNKFYIGKDLRNSKYYLGSGLAVKNAIKKYGRSNFIKEIIEFCNSENHLNEREIFWIQHFREISPNLIYNIADGGEGGDLSKFRSESKNKGKTYLEIYGEKRTSEIAERKRIKLSGSNNGMFGRKLSKEHREKISAANTGRERNFSMDHKEKLSNSLRGKTHTEETIKKMSESHIGKNTYGLTVNQYDNDGNLLNTFKSIQEASNFLDINYKKIWRNTAKNFKFKIIR